MTNRGWAEMSQTLKRDLTILLDAVIIWLAIAGVAGVGWAGWAFGYYLTRFLVEEIL